MSNIAIKMFKLVPIKDFEKSDLNKDPKCDKGGDDNDDDGGAPQRSIKDIIDSNSLENTEFEPSKHYVAEQKFIQKGSGAATPIWLPNEKQLPQFSRGSRIKKSYDDISNILNNNSISDDLKVRLYAMARKKYKNAMSVGETDDDDGGGDEDADDDEEDGYVSVRKKRKNKQRELAGVIRDIVDKVPIGKKQKIAYKIMNVLGKNKRHLRWDLDGTILHPPHRNLDEIVNMKMFLDLVLYKNRGSVKQLGVVADLIKPFFKDFEPLILNEKLLNKARKTAKVKGNLPQYVSWYKSWNN